MFILLQVMKMVLVNSKNPGLRLQDYKTKETALISSKSERP